MSACPCEHTTPCHDRCACVMPLSSSGCSRCCSYGSKEQQKAAAERLARIIDAANEGCDDDAIGASFVRRSRP